MSRTIPSTADRARARRQHGVVRWVPSALTSLLAGGLVAALLVGVQPGGPAGSGSAPATRAGDPGEDLSLAARTSCSDVVVVAVDGNGQGRRGKPGAVVSKLTNKLEALGDRTGRSVDVHRVRLSTQGPVVMVRNRRVAGAKAVSRPGMRRWKKPIGQGFRKTRKTVRKRMRSCPEQQVVLVGYAQGAAVVHKLTQNLRKKDLLDHVAAAVTVSDPYRVARSSAGKPLGRPAAGRRSTGLLTRLSKPVGDVADPTDTFEVVSVCHRGDLVCNPNRTRAGKALRLALSYDEKSSRKTMKQAAERAWQQMSLWPDPASEQVTVEAGGALSHQLRVVGGTAGATRWTPTAVPNGISVSSSGLVTGTFAQAGIYEVRYTVENTSPRTPPTTGLLLVSVRADTGSLSAGGMSTCSVRTDGTAWCWGRNDFGQLGDGTTTLRINPAQVLGTGWARVATGGSFTCGAKTDGTLWCWGLNNFGQLGGNDRGATPTPRQVGTAADWESVSTSWTHACATKTDGSLWCWGNNDQGQLGIGKTSRRTSGPVRVVGGRQWTSVSAGGWHTCGTTASGATYCWGSNAFGQVGDGTTTLRVKPALVAGGNQFVQLSTTWGRTCGITATGGVRCWGDNSHGELGTGNRQDSTVPAAVADGGGTWAQVTTGNLATCASATSGAVHCWGDNRYGQLGPAVGASSSLTPVASGTSATGAAIASGWFHACANGGGCFGANEVGQFGNGTMTPISMPAELSPTWGPGLTLTTKQVRQWSADRIARKVTRDRPAVRAAARRRNQLSFEIMTFNVLGSQHTAPTGGRPAFAPGRVRTEWAKNLIQSRGATLVGLSEPQPDQISSFDVATRGEFSFYPGNTMGYEPAPQSVMWKDSEWEFVWGNTASMPFMRKARPQPVVRLRHRATGKEVYWINAHLSPGKMQSDRDKGLAIIVALTKTLSRDGLPVMVTGDLNEHGKAFRKIACAGIGMKAAVGGRAAKKNCRLPRHMRVDWIFGKKGTFANTLVDTSPQVKRATDHAVVSSRFTVK